MSRLQISSLLQDQQSDNSNEVEARTLLRNEFEQCLNNFPAQRKDDASLAYYGDLIIHVAKVVRNFSDRLLDDGRMHSTGYNIVDQAYRDSNPYDMSILEVATNKRKMLRRMDETVHETVTALESIKTSASPSTEKGRHEPTQQPMPSESSSRSSFSFSTGVGVFSAVASHTSTSTLAYSDRRSISPVSPQTGNDEDEDDDDDMTDVRDSAEYKNLIASLDKYDTDHLKHRGKGTYTCPVWETCQKGGGPDKYGNPKVFSRNCMFRQHIQKHSKPHKCKLPGCPNKEGFARKDQLHRHQLNVKHDHPFPLPVSRR